MRRLIINADDCGRTLGVDSAIRKAIEDGLISSTSVMANMEDLEGAASLYSDFSNRISFGAHLNLTQGKPLTDPCIFLKYGFCKEEGGNVVFKGMAFRWQLINRDLRVAIYVELKKQLQKIENVGIMVSHIDSHQHIHFAPCLTPVFAQLAKDVGILKIRRPKNLLRHNIHDYALRGLNAYYMYTLRGLKTTDYFSSAETYINLNTKQDADYELMCHPGHHDENYQEEMTLVKEYLQNNPNENMVTYDEL